MSDVALFRDLRHDGDGNALVRVRDDGGAALSEMAMPNEPARFTQADLDSLLVHAFAIDASDIALMTDEPVIADVHGHKHRITRRTLTESELQELTNVIYGANGVTQIKQGRDIDTSLEINPGRSSKRYRFRINITGCRAVGADGIQITIRTINSVPRHIGELNVEPAILAGFRPEDGIIIVTGPTGSGKSTLLSSGIRMIAEDPNAHQKILTYESPIEFVYDEVPKPSCLIVQQEIPRHLPSFAAGVRNSLRRAPQIILVGESRDRETIEASLEAAETGHTVYTTLHANSVPETLYRAVNMFPVEERASKMYEIIEALRMIVTQRLYRRVGGGRIALREYLVFTRDIRDRLRQTTTLREAVAMTARLVETEGQSLAQAAELAFRDGALDARDRDVIVSQRAATGSNSEEIL